MTSHDHAQATAHPASNRLEALKARHAALSQRIDREIKSPARQEHDLRRLKLEKLKLKDEIENTKNSS